MSETGGEASYKHIFSFKIVDSLVQNVTYPTAGSKMIQKCLKIWDKMSHAITASLCTSLKLCIHNITMVVACFSSSFFHIGIAWIMFDQGILRIFHVFVWLRAVVCVFRRQFRGKMHQHRSVVVFLSNQSLQWTAALMFASHVLLNIHHICWIVTTIYWAVVLYY